MILIIVLQVTQLIAIGLWIFFAESIPWLSLVLLGLGFSALFPTILSFPSSSLHGLKMTATMTSIAISLSIAGATVVPIITTKAMTTFGYDSMWMISAITGFGSAVFCSILIVFSCTLFRKPKVASDTVKFDKIKTTEETVQ